LLWANGLKGLPLKTLLTMEQLGSTAQSTFLGQRPCHLATARQQQPRSKLHRAVNGGSLSAHILKLLLVLMRRPKGLPQPYSAVVCARFEINRGTMMALRQVTASWFWTVKQIGAVRSSSCNRFGPACGVLISNRVIVTWRAVVSGRLNGGSEAATARRAPGAAAEGSQGRRQGASLQRAPEGDGEAIYRRACALGLEGIVSKRRDARYRSGRSLTWLKVKNPPYEGR